MIVFPNAKINLGLNITSRRPDGYHILSTAMIPTGWKDILEIVPAQGSQPTLTVTGRTVDCPMESNLVMKAYRAMQRIAPIPPIDIYLHKIIPDGAGLGGGSADAAFTLKALNRMFNLDLSDSQLADIAATLGADCPFFIYNRPMIADGIGTDLSAVDIPYLQGHTLLIVKPDIHISTARAYAGVTPCPTAQDLSQTLSHPVAQWRGMLKNDFEDSLHPEFPEIEHLKQTLYANGAAYASLSGSGSAVYGIFDNDKMAVHAKSLFPGCDTFKCAL